MDGIVVDILTFVNDTQLWKVFLLFLLKLPWQKNLRTTEAFTQYKTNLRDNTHSYCAE